MDDYNNLIPLGMALYLYGDDFDTVKRDDLTEAEKEALAFKALDTLDQKQAQAVIHKLFDLNP